MSDVISKLNAALEGRYLVEGEIGEGGMATVYVATDLKHDRKVAIKVVKPELGEVVGGDRFLQEIRVTAGLQHPHVLPLFDSGEAAGMLYYAMPFVSGETLRDRLAHHGPLELPEALRYLREIVDGLAEAHRQGLVHRDIKPGNVLISGRHALIADFGVAKAVAAASDGNHLTTVGVSIGTPRYMAPEQAAADPDADHRVDIFAVGVVAYEMLTGESPFEATTPQASLAALLTRAAQPLHKIRPEVPQAISDAIMRCLEKKPDQRWQTAEDLLTELEGLQATTIRSFPSDITTSPAHSRTLWAGALVFALGLVAWLVLTGDGGPADPRVEPSIAVLPFQNESGDPEESYFVDGVHEEVLTRLGALDAVKVISLASVVGLDGRAPTDVAEELGVRFILEGSVRRFEDQVRITSRLTDTESASQVWAASYEERWEDLFSIQRDIADRIAQSLDAEFRPETTSNDAQPTSSEAYDFFLRGRAYEVRSRTEADLLRAVDMYEQAIQIEPDYVSALVRLGVTHRRIYWFGFDRSAGTLAAARQAVDRALEVRPGLPEAIVARAWYQYQIERDFDGALRTLDDLDPSPGFEPELRGAIYRRRGDFEQAVEAFSRAFDRNPRSSGLALDLGNSYLVLGRFAEADRSFQRAQEIGIPGWGAFWWRAWTQILWRGDTERAASILESAQASLDLSSWTSRDRHWFAIEMLAGNPIEALGFVEAGPDWIPDQYGETSRELLVGTALIRIGDGRARDHLRTARDQLEARILEDPEDPYAHRDLALALAWLGAADRANEMADRATRLMPMSRDALVAPDLLRSRAEVHSILGELEEAVDVLAELMSRPNRAVSPELLKLDTVWDPLREHPRFARLVEGI